METHIATNQEKDLGYGKYENFSRLTQFINDTSDVLHLSSGYDSSLQNFN